MKYSFINLSMETMERLEGSKLLTVEEAEAIHSELEYHRDTEFLETINEVPLPKGTVAFPPQRNVTQ